MIERCIKMLLDTLKLLAFEDMDVQIRKFLDHILIINEKKEFIKIDGKAIFKVTSIDTELSFDGKLLSSRISDAFLPNENIESIPWMYYNYPSYDYFNRVPLKCSEAIQKSMEVCHRDIPTLGIGEIINIDRFGKINICKN